MLEVLPALLAWVSVKVLAEPKIKLEPAGMSKSVPVPPPMVRVAVAALCNVTEVLPLMSKRPMVCVVTPVAVVVAPLLNSKISEGSGVVLFGVQLVAVA